MDSREKLEASLKITAILITGVMAFEGVIPKTYFVCIMAGLVALYGILGTIERCQNPDAVIPPLPVGIPGEFTTTTTVSTTPPSA